MCVCVSQIEERMSNAQALSEGWREIKEQKQDLSSLFQDLEQQMLAFSRRPAELETKMADNMLCQVKVGHRRTTRLPHVERISDWSRSLTTHVQVV